MLPIFPKDYPPNQISADGLVPVVYENWNTSLQYHGSWSTEPLVDWIPNTSKPQPYVETNTSMSSVSLNFTGGVAVAINAPRNWGHWTYNVVRSIYSAVRVSLRFIPDTRWNHVIMEQQHTMGDWRLGPILPK